MCGSNELGAVFLGRILKLAISPALAIGMFLCVSPATAALVVQGDVSPDDPATWTEETEAFVGKTEWGSLDVMGGDEVVSGELTLGDGSGTSGALTVGGIESSVDVKAALVVGREGTGAMYVINGGTVQSQKAFVGLSSDSSGAVTVAGSGSTWVNGEELTIGCCAEASLSVTNGGRVEAAGSGLQIGSVSDESPDVRGMVTVEGSDSMLDVRCLCATAGTVSVLNGGTIDSRYAIIEEAATVSASGPGSAFGTRYLNVAGRLSVLDQATVSVENDTIVAPEPTAEIRLDNTTLTTGGLLASPSNLTGTGTIETHGLVSDVNLQLDASNAGEATLVFDELPGQDVTIHLTPDRSGSLGAGYAGEGMLTIGPFLNVQSTTGYLGYHPGSEGIVQMIDSAWTCLGLVVGREGNGELKLFQNASMRVSGTAVIGQMSGSSGTVRLIDSGSAWSCGDLHIAEEGDATMSIFGGATVSADRTWIGTMLTTRDGQLYQPQGKITIGNGSAWTTSELRVGVLAKGSISVLEGGSLNCDRAILGQYGYYPDYKASGVISVDGSGANMTVRESLYVASGGRGSIDVSNGGALWSGWAFIGSGNAPANGTVRITGTGSTWTSSGLIKVGGEGSAEVSITDGGTLISNEAIIGKNIGSDWTQTRTRIEVEDPGSIWTNKGKVHIGKEGIGYLDISNGGMVSTALATLAEESPESRGTITVDGIGSMLTVSQDLCIGKDGTGSLSVMRSGMVTSLNACIGEEAGSNGVVEIGGSPQYERAALWLNRSLLTVGQSGNGTLRIEGTGRVESASTVIGKEPGSAGAVEVVGRTAQWDNEWTIQVGDRGDASIRVADGGVVRSGKGRVMHAGQSAGLSEVIIEGADSAWIAERELEVGPSLFGAWIAVKNGGTLQTTDCYKHSGGAITIDVDGGSQLIADTVLYNGRLYLTADAETAAGEFTPLRVDAWVQATPPIAIGGTWDHETQVFTVGEALSAAGGETIAIDVSENQLLGVRDEEEGEYLSLGFNPDSVSVPPNQPEAGASSTIHVTANADDPYGRRDSLLSRLAADAILAAHWDIDTDMSAEPGWCGAYLSMEVGQGLEDLTLWRFNGQCWEPSTNTFFTYTDDTVDFTIENSWTSSNYRGGLISLAVTAGEILSAASTLPGDLNGDGLVGSDDLDLIRANWGSEEKTADITGDGIVDSADLDVVRANWGTIAAASVPEPGVVVLMLLGAVLAVARRPSVVALRARRA